MPFSFFDGFDTRKIFSYTSLNSSVVIIFAGIPTFFNRLVNIVLNEELFEKF
jgi:hypothetical protein